MSKKKVLLRGVFINRDTNGEGVLKVGTTLIRVSTVMGILYMPIYFGSNFAREPFQFDSVGNDWEQESVTRPEGYPLYPVSYTHLTLPTT